jgi:hypothetical protein
MMTAFLVTWVVVDYEIIWLHWRSGGLFAAGLALVSAVSGLSYPIRRFKCPHCGNKGTVWKKCSVCGIRVGIPRSAVIDVEKQRAAAPAEHAGGAAKHRVAEALADPANVGADGVSDEADAVDDASHACRQG